jgi:hypothetical protein
MEKRGIIMKVGKGDLSYELVELDPETNGDSGCGSRER